MGQYQTADVRCSARRTLRLDVAIYNDSRLAPLVFKSCDIGLGGLAVETGSVLLPLNAYVGLAFTATAGSKTIDFHLPALVVRTFKGGAGLMFQESNPGVHKRLQEVLDR